MTNLPNEEVIIDTAIGVAEKYIHLDHEMRISRDNQAGKLLRRIGWAAFGKLRDLKSQ